MNRRNQSITTMFAYIFVLLAVKLVESIPVKSAEIIVSVGKHDTLSCDIENQENNVIICCLLEISE